MLFLVSAKQTSIQEVGVAVRRKLVVVLTGATVALGSLGVASAHESVAPSKVTIKVAEDGLTGKVTSDSKSCVKKRNVTVFKKKNDKKVGSTKTNKRGKWSLDVNNARGSYYAVVSKKTEVKYLHVHVCLPDESDSVKA